MSALDIAEAYARQTAALGAASDEQWCPHTVEHEGRWYRLLVEECDTCSQEPPEPPEPDCEPDDWGRWP